MGQILKNQCSCDAILIHMPGVLGNHSNLEGDCSMIVDMWYYTLCWVRHSSSPWIVFGPIMGIPRHNSSFLRRTVHGYPQNLQGMWCRWNLGPKPYGSWTSWVQICKGLACGRYALHIWNTRSHCVPSLTFESWWTHGELLQYLKVIKNIIYILHTMYKQIWFTGLCHGMSR